MNRTMPLRLVDLLWLLLVIGCAAGARIWYVAACTDHGHATAPFAVQGRGPVRSVAADSGAPTRSELEELAANVRDENWFGCEAPLADHEEETAHIAPGYPWLLGMAGRLQEQPAALVRWYQCGLGTLTVLFYFFFARRAFGSTPAGVIAGLLAAFYPFWIINTAELADGVLVTFLLSAALALGTRGSQAGGAFTSLAFGLSLAGLSMVRAALLPLAVVAFVWYLARCRALRAGWFAAILALLGFANGLAPWFLRNCQVFGEPIPIADSAYLHLWVGTNPLANGTALDEKELRASLRPDLLEALLAEPHQPRRYARLGPELLEQIQSDPAAALGNRLDAGACFLLGGSWFHGHRLAGVQTGNDVAEVPTWLTDWIEPSLRGSLLLVLLLGALGWHFSGAWSWLPRLAALAMVWVPLPYLLSHAEELSGPRLPLDGVLLCYAALALTHLVPGLGRGAAPSDARTPESSSS
jgi:hypothetical protein